MPLFAPWIYHRPFNGFFDDNPDSVRFATAGFLAVALYNSIELLFLIFHTFRRYRSLYFWSLILCTFFGVFLGALYYICFYFKLIRNGWFDWAASSFVYIFLITGESLVLYSRLHLVVFNRRFLRALLITIIINCTVFEIATIITVMGSNFRPPTNRPWLEAYGVVEKLQVTLFAVQETVLSSFYIFFTTKILTASPTEEKVKINLPFELLAINVFMIIMNTGIIVIEFCNLYVVQITIKVMIYSIKLKLEFAVLGRSITEAHLTEQKTIPDFVDPARLSGGADTLGNILETSSCPDLPDLNSHGQFTNMIDRQCSISDPALRIRGTDDNA